MNDLNEFMATEVMGWTLGKSVHHIYQPSTWFENNIAKMNYKYWNPTEDMNQAGMCAIKHCTNISKLYKTIEIHINPNGVEVFFGDYEQGAHDYDAPVNFNMKSSDHEELPSAICEAIKQAVENVK